MVAGVSRRAKMRALYDAGWRATRENVHEPYYWDDPLGFLSHRPRTEEAYELLQKRIANGIGGQDGSDK